MIIKKILPFLLSAAAAAGISAFSSAALTAQEAMDIYRSDTGRTLCVSDRGDCENYPQNTTDAIISASEQGADMVMCDVSVTSDGTAVMMDNDSLQSMTGSDKTDVSSVTYGELSAMKLRKSRGGSAQELTEYTAQTLADALAKTDGTALILNTDFSDADKVYEEVKKAGRTDSVIFFFENGKPDEIGKWITSKDEKPEVITYYKGNIIFSACSYVKKSHTASAGGICLATKNPYGVVFGETVMEKVSEAGIRAMAMPSRTELCGKIRRDSAVWWDDLISRGFGMILTNDPANLSEYIKTAGIEREKLRAEYENQKETFTLPDLKSTSYRDYKKAYEKALKSAELAINRDSSSLSAIQTAYAELKLAKNNITDNYDALANGTAGVTITVPRIITAVLVIAGVTAGEIFIAKHTKKRSKTDK